MNICTEQYNMQMTHKLRNIQQLTIDCTLLYLMRACLEMLPEGWIHGGPKAGYKTHLGARLLPSGQAVDVHLHLVPI